MPWTEEAIKPITGAGASLFSPSVRSEVSKARAEGKDIFSAYREGWDKGLTDTPWGVKGAAEIIFDPLNLLGLGLFNKAAKGTKGALTGLSQIGRRTVPEITEKTTDVADVIRQTQPALKAMTEEATEATVTFPKTLQKLYADPRWQTKRPVFENDIDKALFIVSKKEPGTKDAKYLKWLQKHLPGFTPGEIRQAGKDLRKTISNAMKGQEPNADVPIPRSGTANEVLQRSQPTRRTKRDDIVLPIQAARAAGEVGETVTGSSMDEALGAITRKYSDVTTSKRTEMPDVVRTMFNDVYDIVRSVRNAANDATPNGWAGMDDAARKIEIDDAIADINPRDDLQIHYGVDPGKANVDDILDDITNTILDTSEFRSQATRQVVEEAVDDISKVTKEAFEFGADEVAREAAEATVIAAVQAGKAGNITLSKFPEHVRGLISETAILNPEMVADVRRVGGTGVRSDKVVAETAQAMIDDAGGDASKFYKNWKPGQAFNAEEIFIVRAALREKAEAVYNISSEIRMGAATPENQARLINAIHEAISVQEIVTGVTAESGRGQRAFRMAVADIDVDPNGVRNIEQLEELLKRRGVESEDINQLAKMLVVDAANPDGTLNIAKLHKLAGDFDKPNFMDKLTEFWINSILSGPKTHVINALSNTMNLMMSPIERGLAAAVDPFVAKLGHITGAPIRDTERFFREVPADAFGAVVGFREGIHAAFKVMKEGIDPLKTTKLEYRQASIGKGLLGGDRFVIPGVDIGGIARTPGKALEAADSFFYAMNYRAALHAGIVRLLKKQGVKVNKKSIAEMAMNPPRKLMDEAAQMAEYRLFKSDPAGMLGGKFVNQLMALRSGKNGVGRMIRFIVPFMRTPANIFAYGLARSPLGILNPNLWKSLRTASPEASDRIGRMLLGTLGMGAVFAGFEAGNITGRAPRSQSERDRFYREGKLPYAVKVGDTWIQYQRLEPFNQFLSQVAAFRQAFYDDEGNWQANVDKSPEVAQEFLQTIADNLFSQSYLEGFGDLLNIIEAPERYAWQNLTRTATGFVPMSGFMRTIAQIMDPTFRKPTGLGEALVGGIPGASQTVTPRVTALGQLSERPGAVWFPIQFSQEKQSEIDAEFEALGVEVGLVGKKINNYELSNEEHRQYQYIAGNLAHDQLKVLLTLPQYHQSSDEKKASAIKAIIRSTRDQAKTEMIEIITERMKVG